MLKHTLIVLVLVATAVTIANGEKLSEDDVMEIRETCLEPVITLKAATNPQNGRSGFGSGSGVGFGFASGGGFGRGSGYASGSGSTGFDGECEDHWHTCHGQEARCGEFDVRDQCPMTCGLCKPRGDQVAEAGQQAKKCHDLLTSKCGSLKDYQTILGAGVEHISTAHPLTDLQKREGCGLDESAVNAVNRLTAVTGTEFGDAKSDNTGVIVGVVVGLLAVVGIALGAYCCYRKSDDDDYTGASRV